VVLFGGEEKVSKKNLNSFFREEGTWMHNGTWGKRGEGRRLKSVEGAQEDGWEL